MSNFAIIAAMLRKNDVKPNRIPEWNSAHGLKKSTSQQVQGMHYRFIHQDFTHAPEGMFSGISPKSPFTKISDTYHNGIVRVLASKKSKFYNFL